MRIACAALALVVSACQPVSEPAPAVDPPTTGTQAAAGPIVIGGVDFSQPVRVLGTEPFWGVTITAGELVHSGVDRPEIRMPNPGIELHGDAGIIAAKDVAGESFAMAFHMSPCSDGMSDRVYPLEVEVTYRGETLTGCAIGEAAIAAGQLR